MPDTAIIFDVDGVLLDLTSPEEELFFQAFSPFLDATALSRDWNSYRIRNDDNIVDEILETNGLSATLKPEIITSYINLLNQNINAQRLETTLVSGAAHLLHQLALNHSLGIATANFREAARLRLQAKNIWHYVETHAAGADGGGHKSVILARAIASINLPADRIVYIGDNVNDVAAGLANKVHFIGFSTDAARRQKLAEAGASHLASSHAETARLINQLLRE
jgi:phosphoglycolate phosphatase-like HAD superfamily hydrolase